MLSMNVHLARARDLMLKAVLPDRAIGAFVNAALDGTGQKSRLGAAWKGLTEDAFEASVNAAEALRELRKAIGG